MDLVWKAAADKVLVKVSPKKTQTESGIYLPTKGRTTLAQGEVIAAGPGAKNASPGDTAFYLETGAVEIAEGIVSMSVEYVMALQREFR